MTERSRFDRAWPSLVALVGTVAVVFALLWAFGGDIDFDDGDGDLVAEGSELPDSPDEDGAEGAEGADGENGADDATGGDGGDEGDEPGDDSAPTPADPVTAPSELRQPLGILNATPVSGLAGRAQTRFQDGGWSVPAVGDYSHQIEVTTVYYPSGSEESAEALRAQFPEITRAEPTIPGLAQDRLIVILARDYADAMGESG